MGEYLLMWVPEEPKLTVSQLKTIVDICVGLGNIGAGSIVVPAVVDRWSPFFVVLGLSLAGLFWVVAVLLSRKI